MHVRAFLATASAFAAYCSLTGAAGAQTSPEAASGDGAPPAATTLDPNQVQTGVVETTPAPTTDPATMPISTIPMREDAHRDVVEHSWPNRPMLITGLVVLGGTYGASAIVAAASDRKADDKLYLPVVGPWLDLKKRDCDVNDCGNDTFNKALLIGDGALQGLGALTMVLSFVIPESTKKPWYLIGDEKLSVAPQVGTGLTGLYAAGKF